MAREGVSCFPYLRGGVLDAGCGTGTCCCGSIGNLVSSTGPLLRVRNNDHRTVKPAELLEPSYDSFLEVRVLSMDSDVKALEFRSLSDSFRITAMLHSRSFAHTDNYSANLLSMNLPFAYFILLHP